MKRIYTALLLIFSFLTLICCGKRHKELTFAVGGAPSELDFWEKLIHEFESNTGIKVQMLRQPTDSDQRRQGLLTPLKAQKGDPDVFLMDVAWVAQFAYSGWLQGLGEMIETNQINLSAFFNSVIEQVDSYNGQIVALPVYIDSGLLYYRRDILDKYNEKPPDTWHDLLRSALYIQNEERRHNPQFFGFVWQGAQYEGLVCTFLEFICSNRGNIFDKDKKLSINSLENLEALKFMKYLIHKYKISPPNTYTEFKEEEVRLFFQNGNALFERNWPYAWKLHESVESTVRNKVGISYLPSFPGKRHAATLGGWHIGISRYSDKKQEAEKLVSFICSYEIQKKLLLSLGWNPGRWDVLEDAEVRINLPFVDVLKKAFENAVARPNVPYYTQISEVIQRNVNAVISGRAEASDALKKAHEEIEKIVENYHR